MSMKRPAIVIVTYRRQDLLAQLLDSLLELTLAPWRVVVVDNEASDQTRDIVQAFAHKADKAWGTTEPDTSGATSRAQYVPMHENTGGAGGFSAGVNRAFELGADWFWVMDDDVCVLPEGLATLDAWSTAEPDAVAFQGQRYDFDGGAFYWQYRFWPQLAIYNPIARSTWREGERVKECNALCFEGGCFSRTLVEKIGPPDTRFFIYLDDALYGYLASKVGRVLLVPDFVLRRCRELANRELGAVRQINSTSDMTRYYITRNRAYLARYFALHGDYNPVLFAVGTLLTFAKELARIVLVDRAHAVSGTKRLLAGWKAGRRILRDRSWKPVAPIHTSADKSAPTGA